MTTFPFSEAATSVPDLVSTLSDDPQSSSTSYSLRLLTTADVI